MLYSIIFSIIAVLLTAVLLSIIVINIVQLHFNTTPKMDNNDYRFEEVESVKTQTIFHEIVK